MTTTLLIADLHLTDLPKDEYRWSIFQWLKEQIEEHDVKRLVILGDLTDKKDKHSSKLVNRLVKSLESLGRDTKEIIILKGNHDYIDEDSPFFEFLENANGIRFIVNPTVIEDSLYLPHTKNPKEDWTGILNSSKVDFRHIFMHQTVSGSVFANGFKFESDSAREYNNILNDTGSWVYSGDVHVPQEVGMITYVGSPYSINYGDTWTGRAILLSDAEYSLDYEGALIKWCFDIKSIKELKQRAWDVEEGDRAKVRIHLSREDYHLYDGLRKKSKKILGDLGVESIIEMKPIKGEVDKKVVIKNKDSKLSSKDIVKQFSKREKLSKDSLEVGLGLLA